MKGWIEKNIDPPGIKNKNRGSLFSLIGGVFRLLRADANKAFNAHFPYLADPVKLREHGASLSIPELPFDSEKEYRDRVSTASFYLSKAGERKYILENLEAHFGNRYVISEEFLRIHLKITELAERDRVWIYSFLDNLLDPNISLNVAEWFNFFETVAIDEWLHLEVKRTDYEYPGKTIKFNGGIKFDGKTVNQKIAVRGIFNGVYKFDGGLSFKGVGKTTPEDYPFAPFKFSSGIVDSLAVNETARDLDRADVNEAAFIGIRNHHYFNGAHKFDGSIKFNSKALIPLE